MFCLWKCIYMCVYLNLIQKAMSYYVIRTFKPINTACLKLYVQNTQKLMCEINWIKFYWNFHTSSQNLNYELVEIIFFMKKTYLLLETAFCFMENVFSLLFTDMFKYVIWYWIKVLPDRKNCYTSIVKLCCLITTFTSRVLSIHEISSPTGEIKWQIPYAPIYLVHIIGSRMYLAMTCMNYWNFEFQTRTKINLVQLFDWHNIKILLFLVIRNLPTL